MNDEDSRPGNESQYGTWRSVSRDTTAFLERFDAAVATAGPGAQIEVHALPLGTGSALERIGVRSALGLMDYSVAAYAELRHPGRDIRVALSGAAPPPASGSSITVILQPAPGPMADALRAGRP